MKQQTLTMATPTQRSRTTKPNRRDEFHKAMETIVSWKAQCEVIGPQRR